MNAQQAAEEMLDRLTRSAEFSLQRERLDRHDRFGYEADQRLRPLHDRLVGLGWIVETSTRGSVYYSRGGERLRLSNHEVPTTAEREDARFTWAKHGWQVITERLSLDACHSEIDEIEESLAE
jgi:hypothetical protein